MPSAMNCALGASRPWRPFSSCPPPGASASFAPLSSNPPHHQNAGSRTFLLVPVCVANLVISRDPHFPVIDVSSHTAASTIYVSVDEHEESSVFIPCVSRSVSSRKTFWMEGLVVKDGGLGAKERGDEEDARVCVLGKAATRNLTPGSPATNSTPLLPGPSWSTNDGGGAGAELRSVWEGGPFAGLDAASTGNDRGRPRSRRWTSRRWQGRATTWHGCRRWAQIYGGHPDAHPSRRCSYSRPRNPGSSRHLDAAFETSEHLADAAQAR